MRPPSGGPQIGPISAGMVTSAMALRSRRLSKLRTMINRPTGVIMAPPMPWTIRAKTNCSSECGAMMTPVGRLIMVRSFDKRRLLNAMALVTIPALIGPICGPPLGGLITTYASWHWIFLINVPIGIMGIAMASRFIANARVERHDPFDFVGFLLSGCAIAGLAFGFSAMGLEFLPTSIVASLLCIGAIAAVSYLVHAKRTPAPILDLELFRLPTFRASIFGGFLFRLGIGALPFLLPLLLQVGFHLTPFQSGLITFTAALGAMFMKAVVASVLHRFGYRNVLIYNALIS